MLEQCIAKHALNSVLEVSNLIPFSMCSKKNPFLCVLIKVFLFTGHEAP